MKKDDLINKLTLLDTSNYRIQGLNNNNKFSKEPLQFRKQLFDIYNKLSIDDIKRMVELKDQEGQL
jgi:hypothetical protein